MQTSKLFTLLPEQWVCTPDGMTEDSEGNLILACPNFADLSMPSCVLKITKDKVFETGFPFASVSMYDHRAVAGSGAKNVFSCAKLFSPHDRSIKINSTFDFI